MVGQVNPSYVTMGPAWFLLFRHLKGPGGNAGKEAPGPDRLALQIQKRNAEVMAVIMFIEDED